MGIAVNRASGLILYLICMLLSGCVTAGREFKTSPHGSVRNDIIIHFIDVGQGDSAFILADNGDTVLIDAGSPAGGRTVVRYLKALGIEQIDHLIFTHAHDDHIGGILSVASAFDVRNYYDNGFSNFISDLFGDYLMTVRKDLSQYHILQAGNVLYVGSAVIEVLNPVLPPSGQLNDDSIVLRMSYGDTQILFAGDMTKRGEGRLLTLETELASQILKAAHHGDRDACSEEFLKSVRPEAVIISVGAFNEYSRPHPELLARLNETGAQVYRTDRDGSITLRTDGHAYSIRTEHEDPEPAASPAAEAESDP